VLAFRKQIAGLIDRTKAAKAKANIGGAEIELDASGDVGKQSATASPQPAAAPLSSSSQGSVKMRDVLVAGKSEIAEIEGNVDIDTLIVAKESKIGKIKGG